MAKNRPWFKFYPQDWLSSKTVALMGLEERGAYIQLLAYLWEDEDCSLPDDKRTLGALMGCDDTMDPNGPEQVFNFVRGLFIQHPNKPQFVTHPKLYAQYLELKNISHARAMAGKKSGKTRRYNVNKCSTNDEQTTNKRRTNDEQKGVEVEVEVDSSSSDLKKDLQKNIIMSGYRTDGMKLIQFLNEKTGRKFETNGANLEMVMARLKEGRTERDLRVMIAKKINQWGTDEQMSKFLRPATLFNRTKCAQYLGED